jgi:hypothetical protein
LPTQASAALASSPAAAGVAPIPRRELLLWIVVCLFANQTLLLLNVESLDAFSASLLTQNDIYWLACGVTIYRLHASDQSVRADRGDCILAAGLAVCTLLSSFLPYRFGIGLLATLVALYLLRFDRGDRNLKAAGYMLLAVSMQLVWGPIVFQLFTPQLLSADAALVGTMLREFRPDIVWSGTNFFAPDGHAVSLIAACSSFNNVSSAVLACAAVAMLRRNRWVRRDVTTAITASAAMILVNAVRICLFAWSENYRLFWHDGAGAQMLGIAETLVVLAIAWLGSAPPRRAS